MCLRVFEAALHEVDFADVYPGVIIQAPWFCNIFVLHRDQAMAEKAVNQTASRDRKYSTRATIY